MNRRPEKALSAQLVRNATEPGKYFDGNGLYLRVEPNGSRFWVQRITVRGRRRELGLGSPALVSLAEARALAHENRKVARDGGDPLQMRREAAAVLTFEEAAGICPVRRISETTQDDGRLGGFPGRAAQQRGEDCMSLTDGDIAVVRDAVTDEPTTVYVGTPLDTEGPIDFEAIKTAIFELGPLRMRSRGGAYTIEIHMLKCACEEEGCSHDIIAVVRRNGVFAIRWMLSPEELMGFDSLDHLTNSVLAGHLLDTCLERQAIEQEVEDMLGQHYLDVKPATCFCSACAEAVGKDRLPLHMLLSQMASNLTARLDHIDECIEAFGPDVESGIEDAFDLGYQLGRMYSEYQVKRDIEGFALAGKALEELKVRRAKQAGAKSAGKRLERMNALMGFMETLAGESPRIVRVGPENLAKMACEDATQANPALWSQGSGQLGEYLGIIRRGEAGEELKARYFALFPPKLTPH